jgi:photosystem II stability/assembly factor-like uncharacterized protein
MHNRGLLALALLFLGLFPILRGQTGLPADRNDPLRRSDPAAAGTNLWAVASLHADTAIAVGDGGAFRFTGNRGTQWTVTPDIDGASSILLGTAMIDSVTFCAVGQHGLILLSTDAGLTWQKQTVDSTITLFGVAFSNRTNGIVTADSGKIFRTTDGGASWIRRASGTLQPLLGASLSGDSAGTIVGGGGVVLRTMNGGVTWSPQTSGITNYLYGVSFSDSLNGTLVGTVGTILRTTDGGAHWKKQRNPDSLDYFYSVSFSNIQSGMAVGTNGRIIRTTDGGATWKNLVSKTGNNLYGVVYKDTSTWIAVGGWGTIVMASDTGIVTTSVPDGPAPLPDLATLRQNYPNPFNPSTAIEFYLPSDADVSLKIFDVMGREISTLLNARQDAGLHTIIWTPAGCASGVYYYRLDVRDRRARVSTSIVKKLLFLR